MSTTDTRAESVAETLRQGLLGGAYVCGDRLPESTLAQEMAVSQNTVRDALRLLVNEGWLDYRARRGVYVRSFSADDAEEVYALWAAVEPLALGWVMQRFTRVDVLAVARPPLEQARVLHDSGQWHRAQDLYLAFHALLGSLCGRRETAATLARLRNQTVLLRNFMEEHHRLSTREREARVQQYETLKGVLTFGGVDEAQQHLHQLILDSGRPVVRWLAMNE